MRGPLGGLFTLPWFDPASMLFLRKLYLPLSRLWGVADAAQGSVEQFLESTGYDLNTRQRDRLQKAHPSLNLFPADTAWTKAAGIPLHPGADQFFAEHGM